VDPRTRRSVTLGVLLGLVILLVVLAAIR